MPARDMSTLLGSSIGVIVALALTAVPLPGAAEAFKPDWVAGLLLFWSVAAPERVGLLGACIAGLALDVLTGALLGQNALALIVIVYLSLRFRLRIRAFPLSQLSITIAVLLSLYQFVLFWVDGIAGRTVPAIDRFGPILATAALVSLAFALRARGHHETAKRIEV